jgi:SAM-dependent methyltransferase
MVLYSLTIFLSAFLLFEVQPVIAKIILPWFGGSSAVWSTCMLFFQIVLLLGYLYAHWLHRSLSPRRQAIVHTAILMLSLASLPILPSQSWKTAAAEQPSIRILTLLVMTVGLPYFLLSSTSPLLQAWYARRHRSTLPYRLFALSNFASMLALLSYPLLIEPNLTSRAQAWIWSAAYVSFAAICALTGWRNSTGAAQEDEANPAIGIHSPDEAVSGPSHPLRLIWLGLATSTSVLLLAVTTHLTQDVAAIPFLWILPLAVYLFSFVLAFESSVFYRRPVLLPLFAASLSFMAYRLWPYRDTVHVRWLAPINEMSMRGIIISYAAALLICCLVCHGELARLKPHPRHLTGFYVTISFGGAIGGLFAGLLAPNLFRSYYEFPIGLGLTMAAAAAVFARECWRKDRLRIAGLVTIVAAACVYIWCLQHLSREMVEGYRVVARNFYGLLRVYDSADPNVDIGASRKLVNGTINHGQQMLTEEYRRSPVTYFCPDSGIGRAMKVREGTPRRIGILGLGCGTLAAYGQAGDTIRIYEINPLVVDIARSEFTYLSDTPATVEVALGDGRLVLESEPPQAFDVFVVDAFSGDSVPVHLLTREAFRTYFRHLKPDGILAVHISNRYLDLEPVVERAAHDLRKTGLLYNWTPPLDDFLCFSCTWALIMDPSTAAAHPELLDEAAQLKPRRNFPLWTDDFSNVLRILK